MNIVKAKHQTTGKTEAMSCRKIEKSTFKMKLNDFSWQFHAQYNLIVYKIQWRGWLSCLSCEAGIKTFQRKIIFNLVLIVFFPKKSKNGFKCTCNIFSAKSFQFKSGNFAYMLNQFESFRSITLPLDRFALFHPY